MTCNLEIQPANRTNANKKSGYFQIVLCTLMLLGVAIRCYQLFDPISSWHSWRQYDTAAIARNFEQESIDILHPRIDWRGLSTGYVESEFPIYSFAVAVLYRVFGIHEWLARLLNICIYGISVLLLARLTRRLFDTETALFASFFYSISPLTVFSTHSFQPDSLMSLCALGAVYYFLLWSEEQRTSALVFSAIAISLAALIKPLSLYLGLPLSYLAYRRFGWRFLKKPAMWLFALGALLPATLWYWHALRLWQLHGNTFGVLAGNVKIGLWGVSDSRWISLAYRLLNRLVFEIATPIGSLLLFYGIFLRPPLRNCLFYWWGLAFVVTLIVAPAGHLGHDYYQLPIVFVTATFMALGALRLWRLDPSLRYAAGVVCFAGLVASFWQIRPMVRADNFEWTRIRFGRRVNALTEANSLIVFATPRMKPFYQDLYQHRTSAGELLSCDPEDFYLSKRKGWSIDGVQASPEFVETLRRRGAKYFATVYPEVFKQSPFLADFLERSYIRLEATPEWSLYKLETK